MTSKAIINRRNAARSTGPRTASGKRRSAQNARRHGLASPVAREGQASKAIEELARLIAGTDADPRRLEHARVIAEMHIMLGRVCEAKLTMINQSLARRSRESTASGELISSDIESAVLQENLEQLLRLERYEARALSRRNWAIRLING